MTPDIWLVFWEHWNHSDSSWGRIAAFTSETRAITFVTRLNKKLAPLKERAAALIADYSGRPDRHDEARAIREEIKSVLGPDCSLTYYDLDHVDIEIEALPVNVWLKL